jgi:hypothetical protein
LRHYITRWKVTGLRSNLILTINLILPAALGPGVYINVYKRQIYKIFLGSRAWLVHEADLTTICELIV